MHLTPCLASKSCRTPCPQSVDQLRQTRLQLVLRQTKMSATHCAWKTLSQHVHTANYFIYCHTNSFKILFRKKIGFKFIYEGSNAEVGQLITGMKFRSVWLQVSDTASKSCQTSYLRPAITCPTAALKPSVTTSQWVEKKLCMQINWNISILEKLMVVEVNVHDPNERNGNMATFNALMFR